MVVTRLTTKHTLAMAHNAELLRILWGAPYLSDAATGVTAGGSALGGLLCTGQSNAFRAHREGGVGRTRSRTISSSALSMLATV